MTIDLTQLGFHAILKPGKVAIFMKKKRMVWAAVCVTIYVLSVVFYIVFAPKAIEMCTWELLMASKIGEPFPVVAYKSGLDLSDDKYFMHAKEVELICEADDGKLTLTDKTNNKVYEGTYKVKRRRGRVSLGGQTYTCVIDGKDCTINLNYRNFYFWNADTFIVNIDGYTLTFVKK